MFPTGGATALVVFDLGGLNKMVPLAESEIDSPIAIHGWRCSDGQPLRFSAKVPKNAHIPLTMEQAESSGDPQFLVAPTGAITRTARIGFGGYWLWSAPGMWKIEVTEGANVIGDFVLEAKARAN